MRNEELTSAGREAQREYMRNWRRNHKEHIRAYHRDWCKRNPDKVQSAKNRFYNRIGEEHEQQREREPGGA